MRTVARAPRLRRNGSGPLDGLVGRSVDVIGDTVAAIGGAVDIGGAPDDSTAGKPIIVFLRGGLDEGGGVWMIRPGATDGLACDERRLGGAAEGAVVRGGGAREDSGAVTNGGA